MPASYSTVGNGMRAAPQPEKLQLVRSCVGVGVTVGVGVDVGVGVLVAVGVSEGDGFAVGLGLAATSRPSPLSTTVFTVGVARSLCCCPVESTIDLVLKNTSIAKNNIKNKALKIRRPGDLFGLG